MTDLRAKFLADIVANPDDDGPRLVFADWLTQQGDPRGELIVTQIQLEHATGVRRMKLVNRSSDLLYRTATWLNEIKSVVRGVETKRGFVYAINAKATVFAKSCAPWFEREPIEELRVVKPTVRDFATLRKTKHLAKLRALVFLDPVNLNTTNDVATLGGLLEILTVRMLDLRFGLDDAAVKPMREMLAELSLPTIETLKIRLRSPHAGSIISALPALPALKQLVVPKSALREAQAKFPKVTLTPD